MTPNIAVVHLGTHVRFSTHIAEGEYVAMVRVRIEADIKVSEPLLLC